MADLFSETRRLRAEIEQSRIDLIRTDLGVCITFAKVAETAISMGHWEHADRTIASAEKGYSDMLRYFSQATGMTPEVEKELSIEVQTASGTAGRITEKWASKTTLTAVFGLMALDRKSGLLGVCRFVIYSLPQPLVFCCR